MRSKFSITFDVTPIRCTCRTKKSSFRTPGHPAPIKRRHGLKYVGNPTYARPDILVFLVWPRIGLFLSLGQKSPSQFASPEIQLFPVLPMLGNARPEISIFPVLARPEILVFPVLPMLGNARPEISIFPVLARPEILIFRVLRKFERDFRGLEN